MTRWARNQEESKKKPHEGSSWKELSGRSKSKRPQHQNNQTVNYQNRKKPSRTRRYGAGTSAGGFDEATIHHRDSSDSDNSESERIGFHKRASEPKGIAEELQELKESTKLTSDQEKEIAKVIKKDVSREKRRAKRITDRQTGKLCYNCREPGHDMANCPMTRKSTDHGTGICFKCGSTEHTVAQCRVKVAPGDYPFAKCFICGETGHLSKQCPDNPRGLYPNGGCCKGCGAVDHYKKDCPQLFAEQGILSITLPTLSNEHCSMDAEIRESTRDKSAAKKGPKIVEFR